MFNVIVLYKSTLTYLLTYLLMAHNNLLR